MRNIVIAAALLITPAMVCAQATNPESSGAPVAAQPDPNATGSTNSMPEGAATLQNASPTGQAGLTTGTQASDSANTTKSRKHHKSTGGNTMSPQS